MLKGEFERIAGYEVSFGDFYGVIEPMYMASGLSVREFTRIINKDAFAMKTQEDLLKEVKKLVRKIRACFEKKKSQEGQELIGRLYEISGELNERFGIRCNLTEIHEKNSVYIHPCIDVYMQEVYIRSISARY